ncbi:MAG TPA: hypothetical protein EYN79_08795 [Planctomycetes bacterium]|nr:hypothetical protein [Planctomycetota bacterium]HIN81297.1 hypothetical protein [Planctomycetota bacterium]
MTEKDRIKRVLLLALFAIIAGVAIDRGKKTMTQLDHGRIEEELSAEGRQLLSIEWVPAKIEAHRVETASHYRVQWVDEEGVEGNSWVNTSLWGETTFEKIPDEEGVTEDDS